MENVTPKAPEVLGIFAKKPSPGQVKTRLASLTSNEWAAEVAQAFLLDCVERLRSFSGHRILVYSPANSLPFFECLAPKGFYFVSQGEGDLGERLSTFFKSQIAMGFKKVVVMGTDSPTLPLEYVERAFSILDDADVVLGPAADGGYYLLGCGTRVPSVFEGISWGEPSVLEETVCRLSAGDWRVRLLPPWYDVDTWQDWVVLQGHIRAMKKAGIDPCLTNIAAISTPPIN